MSWPHQRQVGLQFGTLATYRRLARDGNPHATYDACVYLSAVLEYMTAEWMELSGNAAREIEQSQTTSWCVGKAVHDDPEFVHIETERTRWLAADRDAEVSEASSTLDVDELNVELPQRFPNCTTSAVQCVVEMGLAVREDPDEPAPPARAVLLDAVRDDDLATVESMLETHSFVLGYDSTAVNKNGPGQPCCHESPLTVAVRADLPAMVERLLELGVDQCSRDGDGWSCYHECLLLEHFECLDVLLRARDLPEFVVTPTRSDSDHHLPMGLELHDTLRRYLLSQHSPLLADLTGIVVSYMGEADIPPELHSLFQPAEERPRGLLPTFFWAGGETKAIPLPIIERFFSDALSYVHDTVVALTPTFAAALDAVSSGSVWEKGAAVCAVLPARLIGVTTSRLPLVHGEKALVVQRDFESPSACDCLYLFDWIVDDHHVAVSINPTLHNCSFHVLSQRLQDSDTSAEAFQNDARVDARRESALASFFHSEVENAVEVIGSQGDVLNCTTVPQLLPAHVTQPDGHLQPDLIPAPTAAAHHPAGNV